MKISCDLQHLVPVVQACTTQKRETRSRLKWANARRIISKLKVYYASHLRVGGSVTWCVWIRFISHDVSLRTIFVLQSVERVSSECNEFRWL